MITEFLITQAEVEQLIEQHFHSTIDQRINKHQTFLENIGRFQLKLLNGTSESTTSIQQTINIKVYKTELAKLLKKYYEKDEASDFDHQFPALITAMNKLISKHKGEEVRVQSKERFIGKRDESFGVIIGKSLKKVGFQVSKIETIFSSDKAKEHRWQHKVNGRNIATFYWRENLSQRLITLINPLNRAFNKSTVLLQNTDEKIDASIDTDKLYENKNILIDLSKKNLENAVHSLNNVKSSLRKKSKILVANNWAEYEQSIQKAGTFELSNKSFNDDLLLRKHRVLNNSVLNLDNNWNNTKQILMDNWYLELELRALENIGTIYVNKTIKTFSKRIDENILPQIDKYQVFITSIKEKIENFKDDSELQPLLEQCMIDVRTKLNAKMLNESTDVILNAELPELINELELDVNSAINNVSVSTTVYKDTNYNVAIKNNEFTTSPIQELIRFEGWPGYMKRSGDAKSKIISIITEVQNEIINQGQITEFNIHTAIELFSESEPEKPPKEVVFESLDRSLESFKALKTKIGKLKENVIQDLHNAIEIFNSKVDGLSDDESLIALKLKVATAKAFEKSESLKIKIKEFFKNIVPDTINKFKNWYKLFTDQVNNYKKNLGLQEDAVAMDLNLSDFLIESEQSFSRLPFIYQRLFRNDALSEKTFFIGRSKEIQSLKTALSRFNNNRFSASILLGEKGSGLTSTLNLFIEGCENRITTFRIIHKVTVHSMDEIYVLLSKELNHPISNSKEFIEFLNGRPKSMIIMENIHFLFLKKIHGFKIIEELTELISLTSNRVFWILSCYTYCYNFLSKSINFQEQFRYVINLEEFSDETMVKIIKERHKVSGYALNFQPSIATLKNKKYNALTDEDKQVFLENQYFTELNKLVKGNIRLGLAYWLSSTREVSGNRLVISPFRQFELSFLRNLSETNLYTISNIILHDRLSLNDLADVMNFDVFIARRTLQTLKEYGIAMASDGYYTINLLLFRQCLIVLKSKNIIH